MTVRILAACSPGEVRVAAVQDGTLLDYAIWRPGSPDGVGDLHRGRVVARVPALAGAFIALDAAEGFLPDSEGAKDLTGGTILGVRVTRAAQGGKGPRLTARLGPADQALVGTGPPALLRRGPSAIEELALLYPDAPVLVDDPALLPALRPVLGARAAYATTVFDDWLEGEIAVLAEPTVDLPNGARFSIHPTPALVAIDIDAGRAVAERRGKTDQHLVLNRALLPDLARQIRLRNLSGAILVDFAGLPARRRPALAEPLAAALARDPLRPRLLGFTALGLAEIVRSRVHPPLHEMLSGPLALGLAALREVEGRVRSHPGSGCVLHAAPVVVSALEEDAAGLKDVERRTGHRVTLRAAPALPGTGWQIT